MPGRLELRTFQPTHWILHTERAAVLRFIERGNPGTIFWSVDNVVFCKNSRPDPAYTKCVLLEIKPQEWSTDITAIAFDPSKMYLRHEQTREVTRQIPADIPEFNFWTRRGRNDEKVEERSP